MEKPLLEFKRFGRQIYRMIELRAKERGIEFMAGPQGQVIYFVSQRDKKGIQTFIRDIECELDISKSVASNLMKRMEKNGTIILKVSKTDKRAKIIQLTNVAQDSLKEIQDFFDEVDQCILQGVSEKELEIFALVMSKFHQNIEKLESEDANV